MSFLHTEEVKSEKYVGKEVKLRGWVYRIRKQKKMVFVVLRDVTGIIQTVIKKDVVSEKEFKDATDMLVESAVEIKGIVKEDKRAVGGYEIQVNNLNVIHFAEDFPITKDKSVEFLMDKRHLWVRSLKLVNVAKVRAEVFRAAREYLTDNGYFETTGPMIVGQKGEEGSQLFEVNYFGRTAYLTQTSQMYLEAMIFGLEKVFTLAPSFRAEKSKTRKHVTEFWHLEVEEAFCDFDCNIRTQENLISHIAQSVADNCQKELEFLEVDPERLRVVKPPFPRITYSEAIEKLQQQGLKIKWGEDIRTEAEDILSRDLEKPLIITHYPKAIKAFYMKENPDDPRTVLCNDMIAPEGYGEIIGASVRETDVNKIIELLKRDGDDPAKYEWYLDLRRFGSVPHAGFGVGVDRMITWMLKLEHIRDSIPFPRTINRISP